MKLKLKQEYVDTFMSCPYTGKIINLTFLEPEMYRWYYLKGYDYLFEKIDTKKKN